MPFFPNDVSVMSTRQPVKHRNLQQFHCCSSTTSQADSLILKTTMRFLFVGMHKRGCLFTVVHTNTLYYLLTARDLQLCVWVVEKKKRCSSLKKMETDPGSSFSFVMSDAHDPSFHCNDLQIIQPSTTVYTCKYKLSCGAIAILFILFQREQKERKIRVRASKLMHKNDSWSSWGKKIKPQQRKNCCQWKETPPQ